MTLIQRSRGHGCDTAFGFADVYRFLFFNLFIYFFVSCQQMRKAFELYGFIKVWGVKTEAGLCAWHETGCLCLFSPLQYRGNTVWDLYKFSIHSPLHAFLSHQKEMGETNKMRRRGLICKQHKNSIVKTIKQNYSVCRRMSVFVHRLKPLLY